MEGLDDLEGCDCTTVAWLSPAPSPQPTFLGQSQVCSSWLKIIKNLHFFKEGNGEELSIIIKTRHEVFF
jgi:hypothetical protein